VPASKRCGHGCVLAATATCLCFGHSVWWLRALRESHHTVGVIRIHSNDEIRSNVGRHIGARRRSGLFIEFETDDGDRHYSSRRHDGCYQHDHVAEHRCDHAGPDHRCPDHGQSGDYSARHNPGSDLSCADQRSTPDRCTHDESCSASDDVAEVGYHAGSTCTEGHQFLRLAAASLCQL
jgi:hypothetical protein